MHLPVQYIWGGYRPYNKGILAQTKNEWRYTIRPGASPPDLMITVSHQEFGGWVVYEARYQITDPAIRAQLWQLATDKQKHRDGE